MPLSTAYLWSWPLPDLAAPNVVILAGGRGARLGGNKPAVLLGGQPLISCVVRALSSSAGAMVLNGPDDLLAPHRARHQLDIISDPPDIYGPAAGLYAALIWAAQKQAPLLTAPCDMPFLPQGLAAQLSRAGGVAVPHVAGRDIWAISYWPDPAAGLAALQPDFAAARGAAKGPSLRRLMGKVGVSHVKLVTEPSRFHVINTPQDLQRGHDLLEQHPEYSPSGETS